MNDRYVIQNIIIWALVIILSVVTYSFTIERNEWARFTFNDWLELYNFCNWWEQPSFLLRHNENNK
jgi:hypothetical protein